MHVAIATQFPINPDKPHGGVESVSVNLIRELAANADVTLSVVTINSEVAETTTQTWQGATIRRLPRPKGSMLSLSTGAGRQLVSRELLRINPDLVHAHDTYGLMVKDLPLPRVFTVHGFIYGDTLVSNTRFARARAAIWKRVETGGWANQPHIISISPYVRERVSQFSDAQIRDIDNPVAAHFFGKNHTPIQGRVFSAATISQRKNPHRLVGAVAKLRDDGIPVELRLAGTVVEPAYGKLLEERISQLNLAQNVRLLGRLTSEQVLEELQSAQIFALTSLEENSPMGIEEAMAIGVPVVTSNRCGMPYMVDHGRSGFLVDPHDPNSIAAGLAQVIQAGERYPAFSERSRAIAEQRFHPTEVAQRTLEFYREILA